MFKNICLLTAMVLVALVVSGCSEQKQTDAKKVEKPYAGQSIMVIVPKLHAKLIRGPILDEVAGFEAQSGAKVRVVTPSWDETINNIRTSLTDENLHYDIFVVIGLWKGTLFGGDHIEPVPEWVKEKIDWEDVLPIYKENILSWNGVAYGLPYDGDCINLYYRKDIFADETYRTKFKAQYGYELAPPKTWKEYMQIASFFNGWDWDRDGKVENGISGSRVKGDVTLLQFFTQAAAYAKHPEDRAYYFDPETMKPRINSPAFVKALEEYLDVMKFGPEGMANFAGHDVRNTFVAGEVVMAVDWADLGIYAVNSPVSVVHDKVGYAQIPGSDEVYNHQLSQWQKRYNQVSSISGNWMFLINKNAKNKKLAFEFAAHMTSKQLTKELTATSGNAVNPSRYSHFKDPASWQKSGFSTESARAYLDEITLSLA
ncbi:MAG: extracellular solute-binding protein, partial [Sulfurimonadaceae bacterium]|nr:extracellular solute-binding protein [Sulfurimonadaceae bacterium]